MSTPEDWIYFWAALGTGFGTGVIAMTIFAAWVTRDSG